MVLTSQPGSRDLVCFAGAVYSDTSLKPIVGTVDVPIRKEMRWYYPIDWAVLSQEIRFGRAQGRCEQCQRPHGQKIRQLPDGRWWSETVGSWLDDRGARAAWPDIEDYAALSLKIYHLSTAHLDHDPGNSAPVNLQALCQRCHLRHDRASHQAIRKRRLRARRALGDLITGPYPSWLIAVRH